MGLVAYTHHCNLSTRYRDLSRLYSSLNLDNASQWASGQCHLLRLFAFDASSTCLFRSASVSRSSAASLSLVHNDLGHSQHHSKARPIDPADMGTKQARVLFDYEPVNPSEISVAKDEVGATMHATLTERSQND